MSIGPPIPPFGLAASSRRRVGGGRCRGGSAAPGLARAPPHQGIAHVFLPFPIRCVLRVMAVSAPVTPMTLLPYVVKTGPLATFGGTPAVLLRWWHSHIFGRIG